MKIGFKIVAAAFSFIAVVNLVFPSNGEVNWRLTSLLWNAVAGFLWLHLIFTENSNTQ